MPRKTPRFEYEVPTENDLGWYPRFSRFARSLDSQLSFESEMRQYIVYGGGTVEWTLLSETMTWSGGIFIQKTNGARVEVEAGSMQISDGDFVVVPFGQDEPNEVSDLEKVSRIEISAGDYLLCRRQGEKIYFLNGKILVDGVASVTGVNHGVV